jgi:hypothetical protein
MNDLNQGFSNCASPPLLPKGWPNSQEVFKMKLYPRTFLASQKPIKCNVSATGATFRKCTRTVGV